MNRREVLTALGSAVASVAIAPTAIVVANKAAPATPAVPLPKPMVSITAPDALGKVSVFVSLRIHSQVRGHHAGLPDVAHVRASLRTLHQPGGPAIVAGSLVREFAYHTDVELDREHVEGALRRLVACIDERGNVTIPPGSIPYDSTGTSSE